MLLQMILNSIIVGSIYVVSGLGITLIFGIMRLPMFAHGEIYMLGAYVAYSAVFLGADPLLAMFGSILVLFLVGYIVDKTVFLHLRRKRASMLDLMVVTFGLSLFLKAFVMMIWGTSYKGLPPFLTGSVRIGDAVVTIYRLMIVAVAFGVITGIYLFIYKTRTGKAMRATQQNINAAQTLGVDIDHIYMLTLGLGFALVGITGALIAPLYFIYPSMGASTMFKGFAIIVLGGMGDLRGAVVGGILMGFLESFVGTAISFTWEPIISFLVIIIIILLRPEGLFGKRERI